MYVSFEKWYENIYKDLKEVLELKLDVKPFLENAYELGLKNAKVRSKNEYPEIISSLFEPRSANIGFDSVRYKGDSICWYYKEVCICAISHELQTVYIRQGKPVMYGLVVKNRIQRIQEVAKIKGYNVQFIKE